MNLRAIKQSATAHLTSNDGVGLLLAAALLGPLSMKLFGRAAPMPLGVPGPLVMCGILASVALIYLAGVRARNDFTLARLYWEAGIVIPFSFVFGWLAEWRSDAFFTAASLHEVSAILLALSILGGLLERRAARGTPADVLARATSTTAIVGLALFWVLVALALQPGAAVFLLVSGILVVLTVVLRLPGAIVPIYLGGWRRRRGRNSAAK